MNNLISRIFGHEITALSLKDAADKMESYIGMVFLIAAAAIEWAIIQLAADTAAPGAFGLMIPVNDGIKRLVGYNGLVWLVKGALLLANLWIFARLGKTHGIVPMLVASIVTIEYGNRTTFPWLAFVIVLVVTGLTWFISLKMAKPVKPSEKPETNEALEKARQEAMRRWNRWRRIRRVAILLTILLILILLGQVIDYGIKLVVLAPLGLRILDLLLRNN